LFSSRLEIELKQQHEIENQKVTIFSRLKSFFFIFLQKETSKQQLGGGKKKKPYRKCSYTFDADDVNK
jgi:hypothetical protein